MYIHVHEVTYLYVHGTYKCMYISICMDMVPNHTSFPIRPDQPCDAGESQLRAEAAPSEQPPSWHQSLQLTDHLGVACHPKTATAFFVYRRLYMVKVPLNHVQMLTYTFLKKCYGKADHLPQPFLGGTYLYEPCLYQMADSCTMF